MSAELWLNDAGVARRLREIWVNDAGTARRIKEVWVNDAGTARLVFADGQVDISNQSITATGYITAFCDFGSGGSLTTNAGVSAWISPQYGMDRYEIYAQQLSRSGAGIFSGTLDNWLALTSTRLWSVNRSSSSGAGSTIWQIQFSIRRASDAVVVDTATFTLTSKD